MCVNSVFIRKWFPIIHAIASAAMHLTLGYFVVSRDIPYRSPEYLAYTIAVIILYQVAAIALLCLENKIRVIEDVDECQRIRRRRCILSMASQFLVIYTVLFIFTVTLDGSSMLAKYASVVFFCYNLAAAAYVTRRASNVCNCERCEAFEEKNAASFRYDGPVSMIYKSSSPH